MYAGSRAGRLNPVFDLRTVSMNVVGIKTTVCSLDDSGIFKTNREAHMHFKYFPSRTVV